MRKLPAFILFFMSWFPLMPQDNIHGSPERIFIYYSEAMISSANKDYNKALNYLDSA